MNEIEIKQLVESVVSKRSARSAYNQLMAYIGADYREPEYPDYYPSYALAVEMAEANRCHIEKGVFPFRLFAKKSPYQTPDEFAYIKDNYRQITLTFGVDYINTISRAFSEGNYSIKYYADEDKYLKVDKGLQKYLDTEINTYGSLTNWMKFLFPTLKAIDAEGVIAVKPDFVYETNSDGESVISSIELNEPQPYYYDCSKVVSFIEEQHCLIDTTRYLVDKKKGKLKVPNQLSYEFYDTENIYYITYNPETKQTDIKLYYNHGEGILPVTKIKGVPRLIDGEILWQSVFSFATDILDTVAIDNSTLNISKDKCAYPTRVYEGRVCDFEMKDIETGEVRACNGTGYVLYGSDLIKRTCTKCNGTGLVDRFSPLHDYITNPGDALNPQTSSRDPFRYVAPDPTILKYLEDSIAKNSEKAYKILHLQTSNSVIKGTDNLTATGMTLDNKSMYGFIKPISDQMFDTWEFIIDRIGWQRYTIDYKRPVLTKPITFDFQTEYDYINEISEASKAGLPPFMIHTIIIRYLESHFYSDEKQTKSFRLIIDADRLIGLSNADIQTEYSKGTVNGWEIVLHDSCITIIKTLKEINDKFFEQDLQVQKEQLIAECKRIASENKPVSTVTSFAKQILNGGINQQ